MSSLFEPVTMGKLNLTNRLVMAPMTRSRAIDRVIPELASTYYAQRASAGLIIAESTQPTAHSQGYIQTPGMHTAEQAAAWSRVTDAVHDAGGRIVVQLTHNGRIGHPSLYPDGSLPMAPSPVASGEQLFTAEGMLDHPVPREMTADDIAGVVDDFVASARLAMDAGFDGVEIHGGNGFLLHQFLADNTNFREDGYGGSVDNRIRLTAEVVEAVAGAIGPERTGIRISPGNTFNGIDESQPAELYHALMHTFAALPLAYVHVAEMGTRDLTTIVRESWPGRLIVNPHPRLEDSPCTPDVAAATLDAGVADAVSLGAMWLANPDLVARVANGGPYNEADPTTFYGGDHRGYTDYPTLR